MAAMSEINHSSELNPIIQTEWYLSNPNFRKAFAHIRTLCKYSLKHSRHLMFVLRLTNSVTNICSTFIINYCNELITQFLCASRGLSHSYLVYRNLNFNVHFSFYYHLDYNIKQDNKNIIACNHILLYVNITKISTIRYFCYNMFSDHIRQVLNISVLEFVRNILINRFLYM